MPFDPEIPACFREERAAKRIALIAESFARLVGRPLVEPEDDAVAALWRAPAAIVAHGAEADPRFFFANRYALDAFETDLARFVGMPSRLSAEAPVRGERQMLLDRVAAQGFIADYSGVRVAATGRRIRIERAIVWNLVDAAGTRHGQAATFTL